MSDKKNKLKTELVEEKLEIPEKVSITIEGKTVIVKGLKGEGARKITDPRIKSRIEGKELVLSVNKYTKKEKKSLNAITSHISNLIEGAQTPHIYTLKICAGHFPMNVSVTNNQLIIKNFIGEKVPRILDIKQNTKVEVKGSEIHVESVDKEQAGQMAAAIELLTRRPGFDPRIFQDGIYIISKAGKPIQ